ncbi:DUF3307 domain-containing protein [Mariluticola halotolerans]|uniref:DUF3307 domain-containing protein n=1 Tax=Mariluticola halotolerans TaxID=2909283 RepID=UPI0026E3F338|nr:DUF3307 domain-containing protein [Mariluticola halotolerans]UJQ95745.1 DUF3307 domain-containing protein [Mariluticola halotolerans]
MFETAIALYAAHLLADFVLQTDRMVANKHRPLVLALHIIIVVATTALVTGTLDPLPLLLIGGLHLLIDGWKLIWGKALSGFLLDQAAHFLSVIAIAGLFPLLFAGGFWSALPGWLSVSGLTPLHYLQFLTLISGLIVTLRMGGFAIDLFIARFNYTPTAEDPGLDKGGFYIGLLERGMIFLLVIVNQVAGIGFLVAAKSILRFGASQDRKTGEYVIIGTLASFTWALVAAFLTQAVLARLGA